MKWLFGGILLAAGILIAGLSGLCTVLIVGSELMNPSSGPENFTGDIGSDLVIGGVPFVIGLGLLFAGRALLKSARTDQQRAAETERADDA